MNNEIKRIIIEEGHFTEADLPFTIKPSLSTLRSIIEISGQEPLISFLPNDCKRNLLGFNAVTLYEEYNLSSNSLIFCHLIIFFLSVISLNKRFLEGNEVE